MTTETLSGAATTAADVGGEPAGDDTTADFVTFVVDGETYAFPMDAVQEIIRLPRTVRVPLGPPALAGLANLRGRVLPIVSLRSCCGLPDAEADDATRVVVVDGGATLGFVVDRVSSVTSVDAARVEPAARVQAAVGSDLVSGIVKPGNGSGADGTATGGAALVKVLDVHRLVATQFRVLDEAGVHTAAARGAVAAVADAAGDDTGSDDTLEFVSFTVDGQEYALPIDRVQEIVQAPEQVTSVPHAQPHVLGVMDLRGGLLPVVGLRRVFGLADAGLSPDHRIVVVQLPSDDGGPALVGLVMDTVREVLRVPREVVTDLPELMAKGGRARHIESVCRLGDGERLVSVLALEEVFGEPALREAVREAAGTDGHDGEAAPQDAAHDAGEDQVARPDDAPEADGDALLVVFRLGEEEYGVDVDRVQEIIRVPETLIRVPKAPGFVEGLVNLRGSVLPVVDLRTRLGLERGDRDERQRIVVLSVAGVRTGFVVDSVAEVLPVGRDLLEPAPDLSADQAKVVTGVANLTGSRRMLLLLETDELVGTDELAALVPHQRRAGQPVAG